MQEHLTSTNAPIMLNAPQIDMARKIIAEDIKAHAAIKTRANRAIDGLMCDIYQSTDKQRATLSRSSLDAIVERVAEYRTINDFIYSLEAFIAMWDNRPMKDLPRTDHEELTYEIALKMLGLFTSPYITHEFRMVSLMKYPMPPNVADAAFKSVVEAYGKSMEPYWVELEMLVQKYHISVETSPKTDKPWWKFW